MSHITCACGTPIEQAIEGVLICPDCWTLQQMSPEERAFAEEVAWFENHCLECEKEFKPSQLIEGHCKQCRAELAASLNE